MILLRNLAERRYRERSRWSSSWGRCWHWRCSNMPWPHCHLNALSQVCVAMNTFQILELVNGKCQSELRLSNSRYLRKGQREPWEPHSTKTIKNRPRNAFLSTGLASSNLSYLHMLNWGQKFINRQHECETHLVFIAFKKNIVWIYK